MLLHFLRFMQADLDDISTRVSTLPPESRLPALIDHYLPESIDATWVLYSDIWKYAMHDPALASMIATMIAQWDNLIAQIIRDGIAADVYKSVEVSRVARQLGGCGEWLCGYAGVAP
ncbi:hypothetical protein OS21_40350 [Dickeya oryzae]